MVKGSLVTAVEDFQGLMQTSCPSNHSILSDGVSDIETGNRRDQTPPNVHDLHEIKHFFTYIFIVTSG